MTLLPLGMITGTEGSEPVVVVWRIKLESKNAPVGG